MDQSEKKVEACFTCQWITDTYGTLDMNTHTKDDGLFSQQRPCTFFAKTCTFGMQIRTEPEHVGIISSSSQRPECLRDPHVEDTVGAEM